MPAARNGVAHVLGAGVAVVARDRRERASGRRVATVVRARIEVGANARRVKTRSVDARVVGAGVPVLAVARGLGAQPRLRLAGGLNARAGGRTRPSLVAARPPQGLAAVESAGILVGTVQGLMDAPTGIGVAGIHGARVSVIAPELGKDALAGRRVARSGEAGISVAAGDGIEPAETRGRIAGVPRAQGAVVAGHGDASACTPQSIAGIVRAGIPVVACDGIVAARACRRNAVVDGARVAVVARPRDAAAGTGRGIAGIERAGQAVSAGSRDRGARARGAVASPDHAFVRGHGAIRVREAGRAVWTIARLPWQGVAPALRIASGGSAGTAVCAFDSRMSAGSGRRIADIDRAGVAIVAIPGRMGTGSGFAIAGIECARIVVRAVLRFEPADSIERLASIHGAGIAIVAVGVRGARAEA